MSRLKLRFSFLLAIMLYRLADRVHFLTENAAETDAHILRIPKNKIAVIANAFDQMRLRELAREDAGHDWLDRKDEPVVVSVGRLSPEKDQASLIRALAVIQKERPMRLVIVGEGPERTRLEALISELGLIDVVALVGHSNNPYSYMARADVFALSSLWEGFAIALVEAMSLGAPVVSTRCKNGPEEIVVDGVSGILVSVGDSAAMAEAILRVVRDEATARRLIEGGQKRVLDFRPDAVYPAFEKMLCSIAMASK